MPRRVARIPRTSSRREPRDLPAAVDLRIGNAVVQAALAPLPEFEEVGHDAKAPPVRRARRILPVLVRQLGPPPLPPPPGFQRLALGPCARSRCRTKRPAPALTPRLRLA